MTTLREAAEMALRSMEEAVEYAKFVRAENYINPDAIKSLREALAQPEPEPVAWMDRDGDIYPMPETEGWRPPHKLLYTHPPQRKPMTDDEICKLWDSHTIEVFGKIGINPVVFARYLERAHGIGGEE